MGVAGKIALSGLVLAGVAMAIWLVPAAINRSSPDHQSPQVSSPPPQAKSSTKARRPARSPAAAPRAAADIDTDTGTGAPDSSTVIMPSYLVRHPKLVDRLEPVLQKGADIEIAAQGFRTAEQFAAVAHAARNLDIPFMLLKHQVLKERLSLSRAIALTRPDVDARSEASRAMVEARADVFEAKRGT